MFASKNLAALAEHSLARLGDHEALFYDGATYRAGELLETSHRLAASMQRLGVQAGDRVLVVLENRPEIRLTYLACWRLGAVPTPLSIISVRRDLIRAIKLTAPTLVVTEQSALANVRDSLDEAGGRARVVLVEPDNATEDVVTFEEMASGELADLPYADDSALAALLLTGGTTGRSKGVRLTHANLWTAGRSRAEIWADTPSGTTVMPLPLTHIFGLLVTVADLHWATPRRQVLMRRFDERTCLSLVEELRAQEACLVPAAIETLLNQPLHEFDLSSLTHVVCGSAPLRHSTYERFTELLPGVELRMGYGLSEAAGLVSGTRRGEAVPGSVGKPAPDCEVRIASNDGEEMPAGETGEIVCRSPFVMAGYLEDSTQVDDAVVDGWLHTGDLGHLDENGNLFIDGRSKDLIIRNGFNVFPAEVEYALMEHPSIDQAVVVGRPDPQRGEEVVAFVTLSGGATVDPRDLVSFARASIGAYKYPREIHIVGTIPQTRLGKVDRIALREAL
ncbi:class I adenylate-forming enzyme family protein [Marmoricola sp. RAF53]|uniref:class I adenylate-forming enzyme family protein n=1 Tax=Marmoricola sp. RAF53 TaxID=3233059 RepID=UPI003F9E52C9